MSLNLPEMILFDLDGTLVDSVPDLAWSIDNMMRSIGRPPCGEAKIRTWIGNGIRRLVKRALTGDMNAEPEPGLYEKAFAIFSDIYLNNACRRTTFYEGAEDCLFYLKENQYSLGCITNKAEKYTHIVLSTLGIDNHFGIIICGDTLPRKKPDPLPLLHAADYFGVSPENSLMVGDTFSDMEAARAAGFKSLAVTYGYNHGRDIREAKPDMVIDSLSQLPILMRNCNK
jgi:phosphoglycolate phosphatase